MDTPRGSGFSLRDALFNAGTVRALADAFAPHVPGFDAEGVTAAIVADFPALQLKARIDRIAAELDAALPPGFAAAEAAIRAALPPPLDPARHDGDFGQFIHAALGELTVRRGLEAAPEAALDLLAEITQRFSMEYALRPFLNRWPEMTLARLCSWAGHPHYHVRRLVSEGTRPRLPWGIGIALAPAQGLALLDLLHADPKRFVTRSVANHLNDVARKDPGAVVARLAAWRAAGRQRPAELGWMAGHALRGAVRAGEAGALAYLGFDASPSVDATLTVVPASLPLGGRAEVTVRLVPARAGAVTLDLVLIAAGRDRGRHYRLGAVRLIAGRPLALVKRLTLRGDASTFRLDPGDFRLVLRAGRAPLAEAALRLTPPDPPPDQSLAGARGP